MSTCETLLNTNKLYGLCKCVCQSKKAKVRAKLLEKGSSRIQSSLDIVTVVR